MPLGTGTNYSSDLITPDALMRAKRSNQSRLILPKPKQVPSKISRSDNRDGSLACGRIENPAGIQWGHARLATPRTVENETKQRKLMNTSSDNPSVSHQKTAIKPRLNAAKVPISLQRQFCRQIFAFFFRRLWKKTIKQARKPFDSKIVVRRISPHEDGGSGVKSNHKSLSVSVVCNGDSIR